jgi:ribosomal protein S27AE
MDYLKRKSKCPVCNNKFFLFSLKKNYVCKKCDSVLSTNINFISFILIILMTIIISFAQIIIPVTSRIIFTIEGVIFLYLAMLVGERMIKVKLRDE